ncbi:filamentous hemagglutinin N-terminal domain-containing protein, partial [Helicobacter pullorum]|uniref:filamentous hemagglutinin N-terminal domain-containing protein n=1 Tax=Helicobacter pullorum TaxID=35818 RepID=UPI000CF0DDD0
PLTNSLTTSNTLKNSNPKELSKNLNKIQSSNLSKESNSKIQDSIKLESIKDSNSIQSKQSKTTITKIGISIVASIVLSQSLVALPSGGKFTHGSGSITTTNGKVMNITGNNTNHIIAWGGGFNINKGESVNFNTSHKQQASFLNLDYSNQASKILGKLNGNNHNIYLVNPSGVLIGENASINANKFVASNTIDDKTLNSFKTQTKLVETFSPVFKPNKGNIVNLGTIKANNGITLIGDTIDIRGGKIENTSGGTNKDDSIYFVGENIYIDADAANLSSNNNIYATAFKEGYIQRQMKNFQKDNFSFISNGGTLKTDNIGYDYFENGTITNNKIGQKDFKKAITLGNGNADEALSEWYWFANGWNNNGDTRSVDEFRLVGNIDFSKQIGGKDRYIIDFSKNENDIDRKFTYSGNYADPNGNSNYDDAMIVGMDLKVNGRYFDIDFNGNNHMLSNIDMNINYNPTFESRDVGIFGVIGSYPSSNITPITIENLIIDGIKIKIKDDSSTIQSVGGFAGDVDNVNVNNLIINNVSIFYEMKGMPAGHTGNAGGFIGHAGGNNIISNVILNNITLEGKGNYDMNFGGFIGACYIGNCNSKISNVVLNNVGDIKVESEANDFTTLNSIFIGGFIGYLRNYDVSIAEFSDVFIYFNPNSILKASGEDNNRSGFGKFYGSLSGKTTFDNINLYYNDKPSLANPIKNANSDSSDYYDSMNNPNGQIFLNPYANATQGKESFKQALEKQNNLGGAFESNKIVNIGDDSNPIYSFEQTTGSNITPPDSNTPNIDLGDVTLDSSDFDVSILQTIINDILNEKYALNIEDIDEDKLNSSNILETLAYLLGIDYSLLEKDYESLSPKEQESYQTLHSLKQSLDFYTEFNKGESDGLKSEFEGWFGKGGTSSDDLKNIYQTSLDKHSYISESLTQLRDYVNGEGSYNGNGLINQISSINNNLKALESLKQKIKAAQKYYQEALEAKLPYETLEGIYN